MAAALSLTSKAGRKVFESNETWTALARVYLGRLRRQLISSVGGIRYRLRLRGGTGEWKTPKGDKTFKQILLDLYRREDIQPSLSPDFGRGTAAWRKNVKDFERDSVSGEGFDNYRARLELQTQCGFRVS